MLYSCSGHTVDNMLDLYDHTLPIKINDPDAVGKPDKLLK